MIEAGFNHSVDPPSAWTRVSGGVAVATYAPGGAGALDFSDSQAAGGGEDYFHGGGNGGAAREITGRGLDIACVRWRRRCRS